MTDRFAAMSGRFGTDLVSATPRGLAAGLLAHLSGADATYVGGSEDVGALSVMVETDDPDIETVHLYVHVEPGIGAAPVRHRLRASRKNVLVQVWGSSGTEAESLIRDLLNDPLLGAVTSVVSTD